MAGVRAACRKKKAAPPSPTDPTLVRLSGIFRTSPGPGAGAVVPLRRIVLWSVVGLAVVTGLVLYFRYVGRLAPLLG